MKIHNLIQGSPEWLAYRATMRNASDAPAMMGCSAYKTRAELLREMHTGVVAEVDIGTQKRFDNGHRAEALARPLAEEFIGAELYPVTGSLGNLSASFDGITLPEDECFEHKALNDALRAAFDKAGSERGEADPLPGRCLPLMYRVQMEQQLLVSGAARVLFMASAWTPGDELIEEHHCWYYPDKNLRQQIIDGWAQFDRDLATYALPPAAEPAQAAPMESLPAVSVRLDGALSVAGNLPTFADALKSFIARMPTKPATDNDFATVEAGCKALKKAEDALDAAEAGALASITDVEAMRRAVADCRKLARDTRLAAEKMVERRKLELNESAVMNARRALDLHIAAVNAEVAPMSILPVPVDFAGSIKGLRSIASKQDALDTTLAAAKIAADAQGRAIRANVTAFHKMAEGLEFLFSDLHALVHKAPDDFGALVHVRINAHKAAEAAKEAARQADEAARIAAAEQRAREQEAARIAEMQRLQAEAERQADAALAASSQAAASKALDLLPKAVEAGAIDQAQAKRIGKLVAGLAADATIRGAQAAASEPANLNLGAICTRLGFTVTAAFLADLGIQHSRTEKAAKLYRERDWLLICDALLHHIRAVSELQAA